MNSIKREAQRERRQLEEEMNVPEPKPYIQCPRCGFIETAPESYNLNAKQPYLIQCRQCNRDLWVTMEIKTSYVTELFL